MNPEDLITNIEAYLQTASLTTVVVKLLWSALILVGVGFLRRAGTRVVSQRVADDAARYRWNKLILYVSRIAIIALIAAVWVDAVGQLAVFIALVLTGLAIALQDPIVDVAGWAYILWRKPFKVGDRVTIDGFRGDVIDIEVFVFSLMEVGDGLSQPRQSTGRVIQMPNMYIFKRALTNENIAFEFIWLEIPVVITFESNWHKAKEILAGIGAKYGTELIPIAERQVHEATDVFMLKASALMPAVYTRGLDHGVELTMRLLCEVRKPRIVESAVWEDVLQAFAQEPDIEFAYPTTRWYQAPGDKEPEGPHP